MEDTRSLNIATMSRSFLEAVIEGRLSAAKTLHKQSSCINSRDKHGHSALHLALHNQNSSARASMISWLIKAGADTEYRDPLTGRNILIEAAFLNSTLELDLLLKYSCYDICKQDRYGRTALHYAVFHNNLSAVTILSQYARKHQAIVHVKDDEGWSTCSMAAVLGYSDILRTLVKSGHAEATSVIQPYMSRWKVLNDYSDCLISNATNARRFSRPTSAPIYLGSAIDSKEPISQVTHPRPFLATTFRPDDEKDNEQSGCDGLSCCSSNQKKYINPKQTVNSKKVTITQLRDMSRSRKKREGTQDESANRARQTNFGASSGTSSSLKNTSTHVSSVGRGKITLNHSHASSYSHVNCASTSASGNHTDCDYEYTQGSEGSHTATSYQYISSLFQLQALQLSESYRPQAVPVQSHSKKAQGRRGLSFIAAARLTTFAISVKNKRRSRSSSSFPEGLKRSESSKRLLNRQESKPLLRRSQSDMTLL